MKKFLKKLNWNKVIFIFMAVLVAVFLIYVAAAHILPIKYLIICICVFILWLVLLYFLLIFKTKKGKNKPRKIAGYVLSFLLTMIMAVIFYYLSHTLNILDSFGDKRFKEENYLILVLKESNYEKLEDLKGKNIAYVPNKLTKIDEALSELNKKVEMNHKSYEQYGLAMDDLINKKIESVFIEESNLKILDENNNYGDIFKELDTIVVKKLVETSSKDVNVTENPFTVYISGIDSYGSINGVSRSDVNMLITIHPKTKQILMISIPRDYYVQLRGTTGLKDKLTHAGIYGVETSIGTIEDLLDIDINYYFRVNFTTLEKVIDAIGGVDVYSQYNFTSIGYNYQFYKGYNHVNGKQALEFARERHALPGGDRARGENQQAVIDAIIRKATSSAIITKYDNVLKSLKGTFQTNITDKDILKLVRMQLDDMASWNITSYSLNGTDANDFTYSAPNQQLYVMRPNQDTINGAKSRIAQVINGEKLDSSYDKNPSDTVHTPGQATVIPKPEPTPTPTPDPEPTPIDPVPVVPVEPTDPLEPLLPNDDPVVPSEPDELETPSQEEKPSELKPEEPDSLDIDE